MGAHVRGASTRQTLIDAAVDLFADHGYSETGLNDIADRARTTPGALYYHFRSKEGIAAAITEQGWPKVQDVFVSHFPSRAAGMEAAGMEKVIEMTFALSDLMRRDKSVWIGFQLSLALGQLNEDGRRSLRQRSSQFIDAVNGSIRTSDLRDDVALKSVGDLIWMTLHGVHLLSDAMMDKPLDRLTQGWQILLPAIAPADSLPFFQQFLIRTSGRYAQS